MLSLLYLANLYSSAYSVPGTGLETVRDAGENDTSKVMAYTWGFVPTHGESIWGTLSGQGPKGIDQEKGECLERINA